MKQIAIFVLGLMSAFAGASVLAQDLTAGKTPAQLFRSDCAECHRSPNGLGRNRDARTLADFLREHYTTKSETAGALAAYLSVFASGGAAARNRSDGPAAPATVDRRQAERRTRGEGEAAAGEDVPPNLRPIEDLPARSRRTTGLSDDGETRRVRADPEEPRPPGNIATAPAAAKSNSRSRKNVPRDATDPLSRLRSYLSSGLGVEGASLEAAKAGAPKAHKRRKRAENTEPPTPDVQAPAKTTTDLPTVVPLPGAVDATGPRMLPEEGTGSAASVSTVPAAATSPPSEQ